MEKQDTNGGIVNILVRCGEPVFLQGHALYTCSTCGAMVRAHMVTEHDAWHRRHGE